MNKVNKKKLVANEEMMMSDEAATEGSAEHLGNPLVFGVDITAVYVTQGIIPVFARRAAINDLMWK
jgi:hypothetical protein